MDIEIERPNKQTNSEVVCSLCVQMQIVRAWYRKRRKEISLDAGERGVEAHQAEQPQGWDGRRKQSSSFAIERRGKAGSSGTAASPLLPLGWMV
jgi:hypothetical protein